MILMLSVVSLAVSLLVSINQKRQAKLQSDRDRMNLLLSRRRASDLTADEFEELVTLERAARSRGEWVGEFAPRNRLTTEGTEGTENAEAKGSFIWS